VFVDLYRCCHWERLAPVRIQYRRAKRSKDDGDAACRYSMTFSRGFFRAAEAKSNSPFSFVIPGAPRREPGIHTHDSGYGFRARCFAASRNDDGI
jgi:hypothetical protein